MNTKKSKFDKSVIKSPDAASSAIELEGSGENIGKASSKKEKAAKAKVIRDSFSFPKEDYRKISELKKACLEEGLDVKKGEILRAGLHLLTQLNRTELKRTIEQVEKVRTGRPSSQKL